MFEIPPRLSAKQVFHGKIQLNSCYNNEIKMKKDSLVEFDIHNRSEHL